jgi:hypothetical protein
VWPQFTRSRHNRRVDQRLIRGNLGLGGAFAIATEGAADVAAYTDSIVKGGVYTDPGQIARAARVFDGLRADALPWTQTQDLIRKAGERWTL